jgi:hypothetical protein
MSDVVAEVVDADVIPEEPTQALVHQPRRGEVLKPLDVTEQKEAMRIYQQGLREILDAGDYQAAGWDKQKNEERKFVKKSGWRKIAAWFDLSIELVRDEVDRDDDGHVCRASVWARAVAPSGRFADGDGYCDVEEERFQKDKGRQKLENDLRGTATTRAVNRAISNLVGMGDVSAEEMADEPAAPEFPMGVVYDREAIGKAVGAACVKLAGDKGRGISLFKLIAKDCGGYMPQAAALALVHAADTDNLVPDVTAPEL